MSAAPTPWTATKLRNFANSLKALCRQQHEALRKSAGTFRDFAAMYRALNKPSLTLAAEIAENATREVLAAYAALESDESAEFQVAVDLAEANDRLRSENERQLHQISLRDQGIDVLRDAIETCGEQNASLQEELATLRAEAERLTAALKKANDQAKHLETTAQVCEQKSTGEGITGTYQAK